MILNVASICGPICVDPDDGAVLCGQVDQALASGESVTLDFAGVATLTSSFLNEAIGCLYGKFQATVLATRLSWSGLDETDESLMRLVQENAIRFFSLKEEDQDRLAASDREVAGSH